jgi:uncharacterized protein (TIGR03435 family)
MKNRNRGRDLHFLIAFLLGGLMGIAPMFAIAQPMFRHGQIIRVPATQEQPDVGKISFDVTSVKQNKIGGRASLVESGNLFSTTNFQVIGLIGLAYKLTGSQLRNMASQLPKWVSTQGFDIEARADGSPTKEQMRLMLQSLLADRFKLTAHRETRQLPVFGLVPEKNGKLGPSLRPHLDDPPCASAPPTTSPPAPPTTVAGGFPAACGELLQLPNTSGPRRLRFGARDMTAEMIVTSLNAVSDLDRPILNQTGLRGSFDFTIEFTLLLGPSRPDSNIQLDDSAPEFSEALKDQLGLKLEPQTGPVNALVIDHIEEPSPN